MRRALPLIFLLLLLVLGGCGEKKAVLPRRPKHYKSIISLSPSTTEIISSDGDTTTLKGRTAACNYPENILKTIPIVASVKPDYEKIQQIKPDLIVYDKGLYSDQDIEKLKSTGADMFAIDAQNVADFVKELYLLGSLLAWESRFADYCERIQSEVAAISATPYSPRPKVAILMPAENGQDYICATDTFLADVVRIAGGELVGPKESQFVPLNAEQFVAENPDVIVTNGSKTDLKPPLLVLNDPRFKTITAVKKNHVRAIDSDVLLRRGQRVDNLLTAMHDLIGLGAK